MIVILTISVPVTACMSLTMTVTKNVAIGLWFCYFIRLNCQKRTLEHVLLLAIVKTIPFTALGKKPK